MSQRHAQAYWLRLQAERAIARAMKLSPIEEALDNLSNYPLDVLANAHENATQRVAAYLVQAELLHREIVRRGGKP